MLRPDIIQSLSVLNSECTIEEQIREKFFSFLHKRDVRDWTSKCM